MTRTFLACAFTLDLILWGLPYSFGVLEEYYLSTLPFSSASEQTINAIGTVSEICSSYLNPILRPNAGSRCFDAYATNFHHAHSDENQPK